MSADTPGSKDYRAAIERELAERLVQAPAAPGPPAPVTTAAAAPATPAAPVPAAGDPLTRVMLLCMKCRGVSSADAHFCTSCGERFNALVVARR